MLFSLRCLREGCVHPLNIRRQIDLPTKHTGESPSPWLQQGSERLLRGSISTGGEDVFERTQSAKSIHCVCGFVIDYFGGTKRLLALSIPGRRGGDYCMPNLESV